MIIALVAKISAPVLLVDKSVRTPSLRLFHVLVMSLMGEILGFPSRATCLVPEPILPGSGALCLPLWVTSSRSRPILGHHSPK